MSRSVRGLEEYDALVGKVAAFFDRVRVRHPDDLTCHRGCDGCCRVDLTLSPLEAAAFRRGLTDLTEGCRKALRSEVAAPGSCAALGGDGRCRVYHFRPLVCRTQGLPMRVRTTASLPLVPEDDAESLSVCPLNFRERSLAAVQPDCLLDVTTLDLTLATANALWCKARGLDPGVRIRLADLLAE